MLNWKSRLYQTLVHNLTENAKKYCLRGNVLWVLYVDHSGRNQIKCHIITRSYTGWAEEELDYWHTTYFSCPLSYIDATDPEDHCPAEDEWINKLRDHYKATGEKRRGYNRNRKQIQLGDIIQLNYRNLPQGMVVSLKPLAVVYKGYRYSNIEMRVFNGWVAHAKEEENANVPGAKGPQEAVS